MSDEGSGQRLGLVAGFLVILGVGGWLLFRAGEPEVDTLREPAIERSVPEETQTLPEVSVAEVTGVAAVPAPAVAIGEHGRLEVAAQELRDGSVLALGLALPDAVRGDGPVTARVVGLNGQVLEVEAMPVEGVDAGLRLEIEPDWLEPGKYMVMVPTVEKRPMAVRRYVLEVLDEEAPPTDVDGARSP